MSRHTHTISDQSFRSEVLESDIPAVVSFWAPWCEVFDHMEGSLEEIAAEFSGTMKVAKVDVDCNPGSQEAYQIRSLPATLFFRGGRVVEKINGAVPKERFRKAIVNMMEA